MRHLIDAVLHDPVATLHDRSVAADELVSIGRPALPLIQEVLNGNWTSKSHPVDVVEAFMYVSAFESARRQGDVISRLTYAGADERFSDGSRRLAPPLLFDALAAQLGR
ncbi:MAG TPA: hypothetical protein VM166_04715 [Gemmatimonadaceae bacterium]|nr:hypothetical protein [Gemmatimonadaceae bacterium]